MNLCIIGSGISGLTAAFYLTQQSGINVEVFERESVLGGRANVTEEGEHCPRLFLSDYDHLFEILRQIPAGGGEGSVYDGLRLLRRFYFTRRSGWVELSHLYGFLAREIPLRERMRVAMERRRSPLVAEQVGPNTNRYGSRKNFSIRTLLRLSRNLLRSRTAYSLDGPTDEFLIDPWARHLSSRGVKFHTGTAVTSLVPDADGVTVEADGSPRRFDAVLVTAFVPDAIALLDASGVKHSLRQLNHTHCACLTVGLDEAEPVLAGDGPAVYCRDGINVLVQPAAQRCLVLCTRSASTDERWVVGRVREMLALEHHVVEVRSRDNQQLSEAVYCADYVNRDAVVPGGIPHVYFAGSYLHNSYPLDSGEGAVRTARNAVQLIGRDHALEPQASALEPAEA